MTGWRMHGVVWSESGLCVVWGSGMVRRCVWRGRALRGVVLERVVAACLDGAASASDDATEVDAQAVVQAPVGVVVE